MSVVSQFDKAPCDIQACKNVCDKIGAKFRVREWLPNGY